MFYYYKEESPTPIWQYAIVTILLLYCTNFMAYTHYTSNNQDRIPITIGVLCIAIFRANYKGLIFAGAVKVMILGFALSQFSSIILYQQTLYQSFTGIMSFLMPITLYFVLIKWNISERYLFAFLIVFTALFAFFEIFQQFTYPHYWFGGRKELEWTGELEVRMGMWRFYLFGINYCMLAFVLSFHKYTTTKSKKVMYLIFMIVGAVAIYFFLARKNIYSVASVVILDFLVRNKDYKKSTKIYIALFALVGYLVIVANMVELNQQTVSEMGEDSEDFIRIAAAKYFMYDFNTSPLYYIFGAGMHGGINSLSNTIHIIIDFYSFYQDDCGFIGYFSRFGILGITIQLYFIYLIIKNRKYIDTGLLLYGIIELEMCFFDFWGNNTRNLAATAIYLYLIEKSIERNQDYSSNKNLL